MTDLKLDKTCIPYPRKGLYWIINLFYLVLLVLTSIYLWKYNIMISLIYISLYVISVMLHGYMCAFGPCPYLGTFCPGIFAMFPVGKIAMIIKRLKIKHSVKLTKLFFYIILGALILTLILPLNWINKSGIIYSLGYFILVIGYFITFILTICPKCAGRLYCPSAKLSNLISKKILDIDIMIFD
jgi:hypothetical protein